MTSTAGQKIRGRNFLMTPGPTNVPFDVLNAIHAPAVDLSDPDFIALAKSCFIDLQKVFHTQGPVFTYIANGHGAWEAALCNVLDQGERVLVPATGQFSETWAGMADSLGIEIEYIEGDWRRATDPAAVTERLQADSEHKIKAVMLVQTDTATGITSDPLALRNAIDAAGHPALFMVDTVAALGTTEFQMDAWGIDVAVGASQKGLMVPPGISFTAASPKALAKCQETRRPRSYWDWLARLEPQHYRWFCGTPPEHLIFGLRRSLDMIFAEGEASIFARHKRLAGATQAAVEHWAAEEGGVKFNAEVPAERALSVTTVLTPEGIDADGFREMLRQRFNVSLGGGLGLLQGRAFRVAHMGEMNEPTLLGALAAIETGMKIAGILHLPGGVNAAMDYLAEALAEEGDAHQATAFG
jgi:alanine-glyoxylate transaminase/serine-glyoxylate transaminase/serine-pyruvate transaminase